jgi:hypothetical protein
VRRNALSRIVDARRQSDGVAQRALRRQRRAGGYADHALIAPRVGVEGFYVTLGAPGGERCHHGQDAGKQGHGQLGDQPHAARLRAPSWEEDITPC